MTRQQQLCGNAHTFATLKIAFQATPADGMLRDLNLTAFIKTGKSAQCVNPKRRTTRASTRARAASMASAGEQCFIRHGVKQGIRTDGRGRMEFRPLAVETGS